eukprot:996521_1
MASLLLCVSLLLKVSHGLVSSDEIEALPGYNGTLPSKQYSGMLQVPNTSPQRYYHYWLVTSETNPASAPVVFWFNGGPGASSLLGYFTEQGPFNLNDESTRINTTSVPVPFYNKFTWAKLSNIIFLESPAGVASDVRLDIWINEQPKKGYWMMSYSPQSSQQSVAINQSGVD